MTINQEVSHAKPKATKKVKPSAAEMVEKMRQASLDVAPIATPVELVMMPVDLIDCSAQVRTSFSEESIAELAADIAVRGVMQPILLRPGTGGRYLVIAGERRFRACVLAQLPTIRAIVEQIDDETAEDMQLAENIQREDLSLQDTAAAVRKLYKQLKSVNAVAEYCSKSKPWVSKHLAIANGLKGYAAHLLEDGITEDMEILKAVAKIEELTPGTNTAWALCEKLRAGTAGRTAAREVLAAAKDAADPVKRAEREAKQEEKYRADVEARQAESQKWQAEREANDAKLRAERVAKLEGDPHELLWEIERELEAEDGRPVHGIVSALKAKTLERLTHHLELLHSAGPGAKAKHLLRMHAQGENTVCEMAAFLHGLMGEAFSIRTILHAAQDAMRGEEGA